MSAIPLKVVGIDQSLTGTGFCYRDKDGEVCTGLIDPKKLKGVPRLGYIKRMTTEVLDYVKPDLVVMEDYAFSRGGSGRVFQLGELGGMLRVLFWERGIDVMIVGIKTAKKLVTGNGNADKDEMIQHIGDTLGLDIPNDNEADACGLMLTGEAWGGYGPENIIKAVNKAKKGMEFIPGGQVRKTL